MLLVELVETRVGVELVELGDKLVHIGSIPIFTKVLLRAQHFYLLPVCRECGGQIHWFMETLGILVHEIIEIADRGMAFVGCEPCFNILDVLAAHVHVIRVPTRSAREDTHQFDGLRYFNVHLGLHGQCHECKGCHQQNLFHTFIV